MTINEALKKSISMLKDTDIDNPIQKSKMLLTYILKKNKEYLVIHNNEILSETICVDFFSKIQEIAKGKPLQYITHKQEFMKLDFYVDENVLIPRPDTEILVEEILSIIKGKDDIEILDMCTGSGAIAVSIAKYANINEIYAIDISKEALEVAKKNAVTNMVEDKIKFINSDMFENITFDKKFDIIVSNPPYIETKVIPTLDTQVQREPKIALDGGVDGLDFYRNILINSKKYLKENGTVAMEIGYNQREAVTDLFKTQYKTVYCKKDLAGNDRVIVCKNFLV